MRTSILFIKKKNEILHLCVDYRALNKIIIKNQYFLLLISKAFNRLINAKIYTKLNIRAAYNYIQIKKNNK